MIGSTDTTNSDGPSAGSPDLPVRKSPKALTRAQLIELVDPDLLSGFGEVDPGNAGHPGLPSLPADTGADAPPLPAGNPNAAPEGEEYDDAL